jgi:thioredoxin-related protein
MKRTPAILAALCLAVFAFAESPKPATAVMANAQATAKKEGKNVMVIFHASWCGWCHKLDDFMAKPEFKSAFAADYVIVHLTVMESPDKKNDENPGGMDYLTKLGGDKGGIPFFAFVDPSGKVLADSNAKMGDKKQNIGHPVKKGEVAHFMAMIDKSAKRMTAAKKAEIKKFLDSQEGAGGN